MDLDRSKRRTKTVGFIFTKLDTLIYKPIIFYLHTYPTTPIFKRVKRSITSSDAAACKQRGKICQFFID